MNDERWYDLMERIRAKFKVTLEEEHPTPHGPGRVTRIEFDGPGGRMRLERTTRPIVLERKAHYSRRAGGETSEEFVYSENEFSDRINLFRWADGTWQEEDYRRMIGGGR